jgi:TPP-dependent 2-oxoacid decarboxylase
MSQIKVGEYLFLRLKELGVKTVFGVPGGEYFGVPIGLPIGS